MSDLVNRIRLHCENGQSPYDDILAFNAQLTRKSARLAADEVLAFVIPVVDAIVEGCCSWIAKSGSGSSAASDATSGGGAFDPVKTAITSIQPLLKTWQNQALPAFISGCGAPTASETLLPGLFHKLLISLTPKQQQQGALLSQSFAVERFLFANKFAHESSAKALSCRVLRKARAFAQVEGADAFLAAADALTAQAAGNATEAQTMALSAHMWLSQVLYEQSSGKLLAQPQPESDEALWSRCAMQALRLLARTTTGAASTSSLSAASASSSSSVSGISVPTEAQFRALPAATQAKCLILLAQGGVSRAVPVAVLFRRLSSLGFTGARPEFMLLTGFGLLSEAPATSSRDAAAQKLVAVYFTDKPAAPLAKEEELRAVVAQFTSECFTQRTVAALD
jgi:hypothetical protein